MAIKAADQITAVDLTDGYSVTLSMDSVSMSAGATNKLNSDRIFNVKVNVLRGEELIAPVSVTTGTVPTNVDIVVGEISTNTNIQITFKAALAASGSFDINVTLADEIVITKTFSYSIAFVGATGAAAYQYFLNASPSAVVKAEGGTLSPASISLTSQRSSGTGAPAAYKAFFKIEKYDGSTWHEVSKSTSSASSISVEVPTDATLLRCSLYSQAAMTTLLDTQTIPIVSDGPTGPQGETGPGGAAGKDAYTVVLTNESHTFAAGVSAAIAGSVSFKVIAYKGATQVTSSVTQSAITGQTNGKITAGVTNNNTVNTTITVTVTASLTTKQGVMTIPVVVDGKTFNKEFSWSLALTGQTGAKGDKGDAGDDAITMVITSSNGTIFKNTSIATTLTAHVYQAGQEVTGDALTALGSIKWYKDGDTTAIKTGATLTISAGDVTDRATYIAQLEG